MRLIGVRQFSFECGCTYEAVRQRIKSGTIRPEAIRPTVIDAEKYYDMMGKIRRRSRRCKRTKRSLA